MPPRAASTRLGRSPAPCAPAFRPGRSHRLGPMAPGSAPAGRESGARRRPRVTPPSQAAPRKPMPTRRRLRARLAWVPGFTRGRRRAPLSRPSCNVDLLAPWAPGGVPALRGLNAGAQGAGLLRCPGCPRTASPMAGRRGNEGAAGLQEPAGMHAAVYDLRLTMLGSGPLWSSAILSSAVPVAPVALFSTWHTGRGSLCVSAAPMSSGS